MDELFEKFREATEVRETDREWRGRVAGILIKIARCASEIRGAIETSSVDGRIAGDDSQEVARGQLEELLRTEGAQLFGQPGDAVDPARHEIAEVCDPATEVSVILKVEREGLIWEHEILQKALVVASKTNKT